MQELLIKYANVLLKTCLKIEKNQPLFISANLERIDFVRIVANEAYKLGVKDIYFELTDPVLKHDALKNLEVEDLKKLSIWNKEIWNAYAKKNAAFLILASQTPSLMKDIDPEKINELVMYGFKTRKEFDELRNKSELAWCIAAVPTQKWALELFNESENPLEELWNKIFEMCSITEDNPEELWNNKISKLKERAEKLTNYKFKTLKYQSSNGTNFKIDLPNNHIWASGSETLKSGKNILVNFPTEEVFTSPDFRSAEGIVYSSKPLNYQDIIIDDFSINFKNGKAISSEAKEGADNLNTMIHACENAEFLGEVALVPYDSPISKSGITFLETLYDENSACHIALGSSFPECVENGTEMSKAELIKSGLNQCDSHVDFMIGTKDLNITGITTSGEEITIFENGNFAKEFE